MKAIRNKINIGLLALSSLLSGCNDDAFLHEEPDTFYTIENIFKSSDQVQQVITSCYEHVRGIYCTSAPIFFSPMHYYQGSNGTDMFDVPNGRDGSSLNDYSILSSQKDVYYNVYSAFYQLINLANTALTAAEMDYILWSSDELKQQTIAEARFFRAFAYRNLGELFGGVPIVTEISTEPRYDYQRTTHLETYQFAIDEMEKCLILPETATQAGKLVKAAVQHNLCQLYIDKGVVLATQGGNATEAYGKALEYADSVIDDGKYQLMTNRFGTRRNENPVYYYATTVEDQTPEHTYESVGVHMEGNVFWDLFQEGNQDYQNGNTEAVWVAQIDLAVYKQGYGNNCMLHSCNYSPVARDVQGELMGNLEDVGGNGVTAVMPTFYTRDIIYDGKWANDMRNSESVFRRTFVGNQKSKEYYGKIVPWDVLHHVENGIKDHQAATYLFPISCKIATDKYTGLETGDDRSRLFRDDYLIRLPETILLRAETKWRMGDNGGAAADINMLRNRAQCEYKVSASDVNLDLILDERARELVYEERRWNTLLRMGSTIATDRIKKYAYWDKARTSLANKNFNLWPIPQAVIDTNKDVKLEQNPGW
ncbi:MAG: RagB/SusD family nutrient uptake outer membrane protein [Tannerella sp.]|jgi:hypothetical protein|nr:RagB/SusD family nutrient uptake outer membrane protein [Tannerella sp.]